MSISIDDGDLAWLKRRAARVHAGNLSAAIAEGTRLLRHNEALGALLDDLGAPKLSPEELEQIEHELAGSGPRDAARARARRQRRAR